jgi:hypothetical protein
MNAPTPHNDDDDAMRNALQRDSARVTEPPFDAALHHATMDRIRALAESAAGAWRFHLLPALATAASVLALAALLVLWWPHSSPKKEVAADFRPHQPAPRASLLAYQAAARNSDEALFAVLDRDARELLPASSPVFNTTLR